MSNVRYKVSFTSSDQLHKNLQFCTRKSEAKTLSFNFKQAKGYFLCSHYENLAHLAKYEEKKKCNKKNETKTKK